MNILGQSEVKVEKVFARVKGPDGKERDLGRVDNKLWAPRAWFYRFVTFPYLKRKYSKGVQNANNQ